MKIWVDASQDFTCVVFENEPYDVVLTPTSYYGLKVTTNQAEYYAVIHALRLASERGLRELDIYLDSQLVAKQMNVKTVPEVDYGNQTERLKVIRAITIGHLSWFDKVTFNWIPREENLAGHVLDP